MGLLAEISDDGGAQRAGGGKAEGSGRYSGPSCGSMALQRRARGWLANVVHGLCCRDGTLVRLGLMWREAAGESVSWNEEKPRPSVGYGGCASASMQAQEDMGVGGGCAWSAGLCA